MSQTRTLCLLVLVSSLAASAGAQNVLFDFENAQAGSSLPMSLTVGGITAVFSATGLGGFYVQQPQNAALPTPAGFSGNCLLPTSIDSADLHVAFSTPLNYFSILYAPQELNCDSSATLRVTAYLNGTLVATATTNATLNCNCYWTSQVLPISSAQPFNSVVVHYDAPPPPNPNPCQDYGRIFMADNLSVTPSAAPILLTSAALLASGAFQFAFTNWPNLTFTAFSSTNLSLPFSNWTSLGAVTEVSPGQFQFTDEQATNMSQRFYRVTSP